jgi:hypothetical protein
MADQVYAEQLQKRAILDHLAGSVMARLILSVRRHATRRG